MLPPRFVTLNNDIEMPIMGLGAWDMYGTEAEQAVVQALEVGYRLIDTAAMYNNEEDVGRALQRSDVHRSEVFVATKLNNTAHGYDAALQAFDESLNKLGLDQVDLYLIHWPIRAGRKESWKALEKIYADGRARAIGVANYDRLLLEELFETAGIVPAVNQIECSPWLFQPELMEYCRAKHIQIQSYCPITRGIKFNDPRLHPICDRYGKTPAQIVLNWHVRHGISTIPKSVRRERLQENLGTLSFSLSEHDMNEMDSWDEGFRICEPPSDFY